MCNLFENNAPVSDIRFTAKKLSLTLYTTPATDNLPPCGKIYPDQDAPVLINHKDGLLLEMMRWGFPPIPSQKQPITNIRNLQSNWWQNVNGEYLINPEYRCLVPLTAFAEPVRDPNWFSVPDTQVVYFAGIWRPWHGERLKEQHGQKRRKREIDDWNLFAFLTTEANDVVRPVHEKAMPVILTEQTEWEQWLSGEANSLKLQRPLDNMKLKQLQ